MSRLPLYLLLLIAALGLLFACGDDDDDDPTNPLPDLTGTFTINDGDALTTSPDVTLTYAVDDADSVRVRNAGDDWPDWLAIPDDKAEMDWTLTDDDGLKTVEAEFKADDGRTLDLDDDIELDTVRTRILILEDQATEDQVQTILEGAGYTVTMGGYYEDYTDTDFSDFDLVFLLYGYEYGYGIDQDVQLAIKDWVTAGGVFVTTEWFTYWTSDEPGLETLADILPLAYNDDYCDDGDGTCPETYTSLVDHPITDGLDTPFTTPSDWVYSMQVVNDASLATNIQVLFEGDGSGAALGIGDLGSGHTIHWSMAGEYAGEDIWSTETQRILTNIAAFAD